LSEELVRQYPERLGDLIKKTKKNIKDTRRDLESFGLDVPKEPDVDVDTAIADYRDRLENRLTGQGRRIAENPANVGAAAIWAAQRRTPIKQDGTGLPDAVVWLTAVEAAGNDNVVLISANSRDFAHPDDATKLHTDLLDDLKAAGLDPDRIRLVPDTYEFIKQFLPPAPNLEVEAHKILENDQLREIINTEISDAVAWLGVEIEGDDWHLGVAVDDAHLAEFGAHDLELIGVEQGTKGLAMTLRVTGEGRLDLGIWKYDAVDILDDSPVSVYDWDWNESMVAAEAEVPVDLVVDVLYSQTDQGPDVAVDVLEVEPG
jgi:hypothetical protein